MAILTRSLLFPQERLELEDIETDQSAQRTDSKLYTREFLSAESHILTGFTISQGFLGQTSAQLAISNAALINANSTGDASWWVASDSQDFLDIPSGTGGLQGGRNFVEVSLGTQEGTPLQRAFWDPSANGGEGTEFVQEVNTVTDLTINVEINQVGFNSGDTDKIPVAIIDVNPGTLAIEGIFDQRELFFRLGTPDDPQSGYVWSGQVEPTLVLTFPSPSLTAFVSGETITFGTSATATVVVGGTNNIEITNLSGLNITEGTSITGDSSGASAFLATFYENFTGADKSIGDYRELFRALMTEIRALKETQYWFEPGNVRSLPRVLDLFNSFLTPVATNARFEWTGTNLLITDDLLSGQATSDVIAALRIMGRAQDLELTRQDGTGGSASLVIPDDSLLYIEIPDTGDRTFSESGPSNTNYLVASRSAFVPADNKFVIGYREGARLVVRGLGEFEPGESKEISDESTRETLAFIGAEDETDTTPPYTTFPSASLSNTFTTNSSLTESISQNTANINDIAAALFSSYLERLDVVSGAPADDNEVTGPVAPAATLTLPLDSRNSDLQGEYIVGSGGLAVFKNGVHLYPGVDYDEVGASGTKSSQIVITEGLEVDETITFRFINPQVFGTATLPQPFFRNYITGQTVGQIPSGDIYNTGSSKLSVFRNGLLMSLTTSVGDLVSRYQEANNSSVSLAEPAVSSDVFSFYNEEDPAPSKTLITGVTGTVLTIPTYTLGDGSLRIYRNGVLMTLDPAVSGSAKYVETSTTSITVDVAAVATDVFQVVRAGTPPTDRETQTGLTGTTVTLGFSYVLGDQKLQVYRNGVLLQESTTLGDPVDRYEETSTTEIELGLALSASDHVQVIYL